MKSNNHIKSYEIIWSRIEHHNIKPEQLFFGCYGGMFLSLHFTRPSTSFETPWTFGRRCQCPTAIEVYYIVLLCIFLESSHPLELYLYSDK